MKKFIVPLLNLEKRFFMSTELAGEYGIPIIEGVSEPYNEETEWIPFNYLGSNKKDPSKMGVHFYVHDYQFERLWTSPDMYLDRLRKYRYVASPEFSIYTDMPKALQVYNHYRKHWVGRYLQENGVNILPTITCGLPQTYKFCFDGEPTDSIVLVSTLGLSKKGDEDYLDYFDMEIDEIRKRLHPSQILAQGIIPEKYKGEFIPLKRGYKLFGRENYQ